jgi:hypothetical protein
MQKFQVQVSDRFLQVSSRQNQQVKVPLPLHCRYWSKNLKGTSGSNAVSPMLKFFLDEKQVAQKQCTLGPSARRRLIRRLILSH